MKSLGLLEIHRKDNIQDKIGCFDRLRADCYNQDDLHCILIFIGNVYKEL